MPEPSVERHHGRAFPFHHKTTPALISADTFDKKRRQFCYIIFSTSVLRLHYRGASFHPLIKPASLSASIFFLLIASSAFSSSPHSTSLVFSDSIRYIFLATRPLSRLSTRSSGGPSRALPARISGPQEGGRGWGGGTKKAV